MGKTKKLTLIEGSFSAKDSREILMSVFMSKLHFHETKNFSSKERFGKVDELANIKIPQLKNSMKVLDEFLAKAEENEEYIIMKSEINIKSVKLKDV